MHIDVHTLLAQSIGAIAMPLFQQMLKDKPWVKWLDRSTDTRNTLVAAGTALAATGAAVVFDGSIETGGTMTVSVPSAESLITFGIMSAMQFFAQKGVYHGHVKPRGQATPPEPAKPAKPRVRRKSA